MSLPRGVSTAQLVTLWGVNRQRVSVLVDSRDFPRGEDLGNGRMVWAFWDVVAWSREQGRRMYPVPGYPDPADDPRLPLPEMTEPLPLDGDAS